MFCLSWFTQDTQSPDCETVVLSSIKMTIYMHDLPFINFVDSMLLLCLDPVGSVSRVQRYQGLNLLFGGWDSFFMNCFFGLLHLLDTSSLHRIIDSN